MQISTTTGKVSISFAAGMGTQKQSFQWNAKMGMGSVPKWEWTASNLMIGSPARRRLLGPGIGKSYCVEPFRRRSREQDRCPVFRGHYGEKTLSEHPGNPCP